MCKGGCGDKPAMWIDSGIHAREWIAPAVGTWMLNQLVENSADHPELLDSLDWCCPALIVFSLISSNSNDIHNRYFLPSHNPDGYHKSQEEDRMWRKTTTHYDNDLCQVLEL